MADTKNIKQTDAEKESIVINKITIRSVDRTRKDIKDWRHALEYAEAVIYPRRTKLYDLYADVELDGHLTGIINKRFDSVLNKEMLFEVNGKKVDVLDDLINSQPFRKMQKEILKSITHGISGLEFIPGKDFAFASIPRKHIKPHVQVISFEQSGEDGIPYNDVSNLWVVGDKDDLGLLLKCAPYAIYKKGNFADWAQYVEIFGQPVRIIKYDAHDKATKMELTEVLEESGSSLALMIPKQADFEMKDGKQSNGDGQLQQRLKDACNEEMSIIILGNTETTKSSNTSGYAQAEIHSGQQAEIMRSDMAFLLNMLNTPKFLSILQSYGYPVQGGKFTFAKQFDLKALKDKKDIDLAIANKVPVDDDYWYNTYGIPKPDNYDELRAKMDAEKEAKLANESQPTAPAKPAAKPPVKKPVKPSLSDEETETENSLTWLERFRASLADFFAPGHES